MNQVLMQRRARQQREDRQGYVIMGGCGVVLALGLAAVVMAKPVEREASNGCPKGHKTPHQHVAVVDRTEAWSDSDKSVLREALLSLTANAKLDERVTVVAFDGDGAPVTLFDRCRPPQGKDVSAAVSTPARVEHAFNTSFMQPLTTALNEVTKKAQAKETHLVAFLSGLTATLSYRNEAEATTLHVFSDMGEHTPEGTLLGDKRKAMDAAAFKSYFGNLMQNHLQGVALDVHVVPTPSTNNGVAKRIKDAWSAALDSNGVTFEWRTL